MHSLVEINPKQIYKIFHKILINKKMMRIIGYSIIFLNFKKNVQLCSQIVVAQLP